MEYVILSTNLLLGPGQKAMKCHLCGIGQTGHHALLLAQEVGNIHNRSNCVKCAEVKGIL